jgi:membrane dipeptidase
MGLLLHPGMIDLEKPTLARAVDHIAYVADLVGIEHVGLGTDLGEGFIMDSPGNLAGESLLPAGMLMTTIEGCAEINELPNLCAEMEHRGFNSEEIALVMGGNFMRVMQQVLVR